MTAISSAAWIAHDVGLAAALGGTMFGRVALQPALREISIAEDRDLVASDAWRRFSWINLVGHAAFAATWLVGRSMLSGREVSAQARSLTKLKDVLVGASVVTGIASILFGRLLGKRVDRGLGPEELADTTKDAEIKKTRMMKRSVNMLGLLNLFATIGVIGVTSVLAMEAGKSARFAPLSRVLP